MSHHLRFLWGTSPIVRSPHFQVGGLGIHLSSRFRLNEPGYLSNVVLSKQVMNHSCCFCGPRQAKVQEFIGLHVLGLGGSRVYVPNVSYGQGSSANVALWCCAHLLLGLKGLGA
jgi:hypothetical protein